MATRPAWSLSSHGSPSRPGWSGWIASERRRGRSDSCDRRPDRLVRRGDLARLDIVRQPCKNETKPNNQEANMRDNPQTTTRNLAESIVRRERGIDFGYPDADRVEDVKEQLDKIAKHLGLEKSYLIGASAVDILDLYEETKISQ